LQAFVGVRHASLPGGEQHKHSRGGRYSS
jgi:hypothetical protein